MATNRRAVIDVGTNSVKLLLADVSGQTVRPLLECSRQTRLGHGFYESRRLNPEAISQTAVAAAEFAGLARHRGAESVRLIATSVAREASNQADLATAIQQSANLPLEIISSQQEADWAFHGVKTDPRFADRPLIVLDAGGGSSQLVFNDNSGRITRFSLALGAVRLLEQLKPSDPPHPDELSRCRSMINDFLSEHLQSVADRSPSVAPPDNAVLVGAGGTASVLASMKLGLPTFDREQIESIRLNRAELSSLMQKLWSMPLADRKELRGLPPSRADVILTGAAIHIGFMEFLGFTDLEVSTRGLRFAALLDDQTA